MSLRFRGKWPAADSEMSADRQSDEIVGVRQRVGFIEIIHTPDQAPFGVPPCSEILDVQVAHCQHLGTFCQLGTN